MLLTWLLLRVDRIATEEDGFLKSDGIVKNAGGEDQHNLSVRQPPPVRPAPT